MGLKTERTEVLDLEKLTTRGTRQLGETVGYGTEVCIM